MPNKAMRVGTSSYIRRWTINYYTDVSPRRDPLLSVEPTSVLWVLSNRQESLLEQRQ